MTRELQLCPCNAATFTRGFKRGEWVIVMECQDCGYEGVYDQTRTDGTRHYKPAIPKGMLDEDGEARVTWETAYVLIEQRGGGTISLTKEQARLLLRWLKQELV